MKDNKQNFELSVSNIEKIINRELCQKYPDFNFDVSQNENNSDVYVTITREDVSKTIRLTSNENDIKKFCYVSSHTKPSKIVKLIEDVVKRIADNHLATILDNLYSVMY